MGIFKNILGTEKVIDGVGEILDNVITNKEEKLNAKAKIKEIMNSYKIEVEKNITARWEADTNGNILTRSVRPLVLIFLIVCTMLLVFIDSGSISFQVEDKWTDLLQLTLITVIGAYFGGRSVEKFKKK
jgi:preprotein translocase subunit SecG